MNFRLAIICINLFCSLTLLHAQQSGEDIQLIAGRQFNRIEDHSTHPGPHKQHSIIGEYNPVSLVLKGAILGYQQIVTTALPRPCPYDPDCPDFSRQAMEEFGIIKGVFIGVDRMLRCNRIGLLDVSPTSVNPSTGEIVDPPNLYR